MSSNFLIVAVVFAASIAFGLYRRRTDGRMRRYTPATVTRPDDAEGGRKPEAIGELEIGAPLGARATLLQFSSEHCQPCRDTSRVLTELSSQVEGVSHVELDAAAHSELVRRLAVMRTPTVFLLDHRGLITRRPAGLVRRQEIHAALEAVTGGNAP